MCCRVFVNTCISVKMCTKTVKASAFGSNGDGFTEQCLWPKAFVSRDRVDKARRCDRGPHEQEQLCFHFTIGGWKTVLKSGERAVKRSLWLRVVRLIILAQRCSRAKSGGPMRLAWKEVRRAAQAEEKQLGRKNGQQTEL